MKTPPLTMREKIQRRGGEYPSREEWDAVDWSKPRKQIAAEMRVMSSTVSRQQALRGIYLPNTRLGQAMQILKEVDESNRKAIEAMHKRGLAVPAEVADLIERISQFLGIDR